MSDGKRTTRRRWLASCAAATGGIGALAGCTSEGDDEGEETSPGDTAEGGAEEDNQEPDEPEGPEGWPQYGVDNRLSGHHPTATGPDGEIEVKWEVEPGSGTRMDAQPVIADGVCYCGSIGGEFWAVDLEDGEVLWTYDDIELSMDIIEHCLLHDDTVYVGWRGGVIALDREDGTERWSERGGVQRLTRYDGGLYGLDDSELCRFDRSDGERSVVHEFDGEVASTEVAIRDGLAYGTYTDRVVAIDLEDGGVAWEWNLPQEYGAELNGTLAVGDGAVYAPSGETSAYSGSTPDDEDDWGRLFAIEADSGEERWRQRFEGHPLARAPAVADGTVYHPTFRVYALDTTDGELLWQNDDVHSHVKLSVVDETVYGWGSDLYAIDATDGTTEWTFDEYTQAQSGGTLRPMPAIYDEHIVLEVGGQLVALEAA